MQGIVCYIWRNLSYQLCASYYPRPCAFTENLGGSHDYHHPHFINEKQKSLTQECAMPKVTQWMRSITDSTILEHLAPISVISLTLQTAEDLKIQEKELERLMRKEWDQRKRSLIKPEVEGREYRKQKWMGWTVPGRGINKWRMNMAKRFPHSGKSIYNRE